MTSHEYIFLDLHLWNVHSVPGFDIDCREQTSNEASHWPGVSGIASLEKTHDWNSHDRYNTIVEIHANLNQPYNFGKNVVTCQCQFSTMPVLYIERAEFPAVISKIFPLCNVRVIFQSYRFYSFSAIQCYLLQTLFIFFIKSVEEILEDTIFIHYCNSNCNAGLSIPWFVRFS